MIDPLVRASIEGIVIVSAIWLVLRALPRLSPGAKAMLWWCAAAKVVVSLASGPPLALPILPAAAASMTLSSRQSEPVVSNRYAGIDGAAAATAVGAADVSIPWPTVALWLWSSGCAVSLGLALRRWRKTRQTIARSHSAPESVERLTSELCELLTLGKPSIRLSNEVHSPLVTGLIGPVVLLPETRFRQLSGEQQRMALCHELVHIKRFDLWLGCIPAAAERLFFFHPLVRLATREFAFWREAACDAAVLRALDAPAQSYGRLLLDLGVSPNPRSLTAAGAAWSFATMKRRIVMLHSARESSVAMRVASVAAVGLALVATAPLTLGARPSPSSPQVVAGPEIVAESRNSEDGLRFVFFASANQTTMSGRGGDVDKARRHRTGGDPLLWFIKDGREYIVRDPSILGELQGVWGGVTAVGAEQSGVGSKQAAIGARQAEIGSRQATIGAEQANIGARQAAIGARQAAVALQETKARTEAERAALERDRRALDDDMRALDAEMRKVDEKMRALDAPMRDLDDDMRGLDDEMRVLDAKMREAEKKAEAAMRALIDRAIASGAAQRVE